MKFFASLMLSIAITGCSCPCQRFVPAGDLVLDTRTGRWCSGATNHHAVYPDCYDLYTGKVK